MTRTVNEAERCAGRCEARWAKALPGLAWRRFGSSTNSESSCFACDAISHLGDRRERRPKRCHRVELWSAVAWPRLGLFHHATANQAVSPATRFPTWETAANVGQSAATALNFGVRCPGSPGAALASSTTQTANQAVSPATRFSTWETAANVGQSAARPAHSKLQTEVCATTKR